jgi:hypothetical protein
MLVSQRRFLHKFVDSSELMHRPWLSCTLVREVSKLSPKVFFNIEGRQLDANFAAELYAINCGLLGIDAMAGTYLHVERRDVASEKVMYGTLSVVGREDAASAKRDVVDNDVSTKIAATILNFIAKDDPSTMEKRNFSASAAASIAANVLGSSVSVQRLALNSLSGGCSLRTRALLLYPTACLVRATREKSTLMLPSTSSAGS